ncbi:MAG TPA: ubiquinone-binding protein [Alphaproteobacteria bacterium]|nr:ubiquinone-binding protein [Alphaproteobacteria bacterium]
MPAHFDRRKSRHSPEELFAIVADVEKYPEFLPWVCGARVIERSESYFIAELVVRFKGFSQKYSSKVTLKPAKTQEEPSFIDVELVHGPFKHLSNKWSFYPHKGGGTEVTFDLDFKFISLFFEKMIGIMFEKAIMKMSEAFEKRAEDLLKK